jgi:hypothetical protein
VRSDISIICDVVLVFHIKCLLTVNIKKNKCVAVMVYLSMYVTKSDLTDDVYM